MNPQIFLSIFLIIQFRFSFHTFYCIRYQITFPLALLQYILTSHSVFWTHIFFTFLVSFAICDIFFFSFFFDLFVFILSGLWKRMVLEGGTRKGPETDVGWWRKAHLATKKGKISNQPLRHKRSGWEKFYFIIFSFQSSQLMSYIPKMSIILVLKLARLRESQLKNWPKRESSFPI